MLYPKYNKNASIMRYGKDRTLVGYQRKNCSLCSKTIINDILFRAGMQPQPPLKFNLTSSPTINNETIRQTGATRIINSENSFNISFAVRVL